MNPLANKYVEQIIMQLFILNYINIFRAIASLGLGPPFPR